MAYIEDALFIQHADRLASQYNLLKTALDACVPGTLHYNIAAGDAVDKYSMINALATGWNNQDAEFSDPSSILQGAFADGTNADSSHATAEGASSLDGYLSVGSGTSIQVHEYYADAVSYARSETLSAANVFKRQEEQICHFNASSSGVGTFTHVAAIGTGSGDYEKDVNYGAVQLEVLVMSGIGSNNLILNLYGTQTGATHAYKQVTIPAASPAGTIVDVGIATDAFVDVVVANSQVAGGDTGDGVIVRSKLLRTIALG